MNPFSCAVLMVLAWSLVGCVGLSHSTRDSADDVMCEADSHGRVTVIGWQESRFEKPTQEEVASAQDYALDLLKFCIYREDPTQEPSAISYERVIWEQESRFIFAQVSGVPRKQIMHSKKRRR